MHGSIDQPQDFVLTRTDYLRHDDRRTALRGVVQAMLITRHMLFVRFSLTDENFLRIADDVRRAVREPRGRSAEPFGTALTLTPDELMRDLWSDDIRTVPMTDAKGEDRAVAGRQLELFFDRVLCETSTGSRHLLDRSYTAALTDEERALRDHVRAFFEELPPGTDGASAFGELERLWRRLGGGAMPRPRADA